MKELDDIIDKNFLQEPKTYHPVKCRDKDAWFPGNEASSLVVQIRHVLDDIRVLRDLYQSDIDDYAKKLILKYVVIEVRSLIKLLDKLQGKVMSAPVFDPREQQGWREITIEEREKAKVLFKKFSLAKKEVKNKIISIRNNIGAHRGNLDWQQVMKFWDLMEPELVNPLLSEVPELFDYIKSLDLYEWNKISSRGNPVFLGIQLRPEYFEKDNET